MKRCAPSVWSWKHIVNCFALLGILMGMTSTSQADQSDPFGGIADEKEDVRPPVSGLYPVLPELKKSESGQGHPKARTHISPPPPHGPPPEKGEQPQLQANGDDAGERAD